MFGLKSVAQGGCAGRKCCEPNDNAERRGQAATGMLLAQEFQEGRAAVAAGSGDDAFPDVHVTAD